MSTEWIVLAAIALAALIISVITLIISAGLRRTLQGGPARPVEVAPPAALSGREESGNVFCRSCGNMYDSVLSVCPACQTPRR